MSILTQKTINEKITFKGVGLHTGKSVELTLIPSNANTGIIFRRTDLIKNNIIIPAYNNVVDTTLCTTLSNNHGAKVSTIEHLMGALYGLGIDNLIVEVNSQEIPILDGSAKIFVEKILSTGLKSLNAPIKLIKIEKKISYQEGNKKIFINKSKVASEIDFQINFNNKVIGVQRNKINIFNDNLNSIFESRTFCLYEDVEKLKKAGLAQGGSLENAVVVGDEKVLNDGGLRNSNEFVNHKILDCMGDLYLSGYRIVGSIETSQGGHGLTNKILRKLFSDKSNFTVIEIKEKTLPHQILDRTYLKSIA
ncbi:UDP-3-O-acyl-N-acetylglucosamine deacetylase [Candidatus Pelagibacter sp.]|nr:UDP-3-O-acyl-N-acetylglucosamine deacetylase [Candidatus Pelagibacter sp.]|tara:strand:- start:123 stop:1043 length:921 start_codon:yes stop_codon:yes gene_type:complete